jgi:ATP-dependent Lon protease
MNLTLISLMCYDEILEYIIVAYTREFGERKFKTVLDKIMTSNKISGLISTLKNKGVPPGSKDFLYCLNEIPYFIFSRGQTQAVAALIALQRWNQEVNSKQYLLSEDGLRLRAVNILKETKITFF